MDTALWIVQGLLLVAFLGAGTQKIFRSKDQLMESGMEFVEDFSDTTVKQIGIVEVLGAIGIVLPMVLDIVPVLTPVAAVGLILVMLGAVSTHLRRQEYAMIGVNTVLLLLALLVAYGRFIAEPVI